MRSAELHSQTPQFVETIAFAFSIMGVVASVSSTFSFPLQSGTPCPMSHAPAVSSM